VLKATLLAVNFSCINHGLLCISFAGQSDVAIAIGPPTE